jgi:phosphomannomutase
MDLALAAAATRGADIVLANDPDADRCAVAVPDATAATGWRMLSGDEVGALLATHLLRRDPQSAGTFAASIVSSSLVGRLAEAQGVAYAETLTGFKWITRVENLRFGYEEALGYCVDPDAVKDKDGVSAALLLAELAAEVKAAGRTLVDLLDEIAVRFGLHATDQLSVRVSALPEIAAAMNRLRTQPPVELGGRAVNGVDDLAEGSAGLPPTEGLRYWLADGGRVIVRPSGTEPKLKCYLEVVQPVPDGDVAAARRTASAALSAIKRDVARAAGLDGARA